MKIQTTITIESVRCGACGHIFGLETAYHQKLKSTGKSFYCPGGCCISYSETDAKRLEKEREARIAEQRRFADRLELEVSRRQHAERSAISQRGAMTKLKKRVGSGVCPCCNRAFQNLAAHMKGQHPEFSDGARQ